MRGNRHLGEDGLSHRFHVFQHIRVPEPQHPETHRPQRIIARSVSRIRGMLLAVDLHDEPFLRTQKIRDVATDGNLPAKFQAANAAVLRMMPEARLGLRGLTAHALGEAGEFRLCSSLLLRGGGDHG